MSRVHRIAVAAAFSLTFAISLPSSVSATDLPGGSWAASCLGNAKISNGILFAKCGKIDGTFVDTFINLDRCNKPVAVGNNDGQLVCESGGGGLPPGSWSASCQNPKVQNNKLSADCFDTAGVLRSSTIDLRQCSGDIANLDGKLVC